MTVSRQALGSLTPIASGSFGAVYEATVRTNSGKRKRMAYKEFLPGQDPAVRAELVRAAIAAVAFRESLRPDDVIDLDMYTVWPHELVGDSRGRITGFLMPLLTEDFFISVDDDPPKPPQRKVRDLAWLIATPKQLQVTGVDLDVDTVERLILMAQLCYAIGRLHKHGWVYGDLSYKNACFALNPPRLILLDCDGVARLTDTARTQGTTEFWTAPENDGTSPQTKLQDFATDAYKVALAILRCLLPGRAVSTAKNPQRLVGKLPPEGVAMLEAGLSVDGDRRPTAKDWFVFLDDEITRLTEPPDVRTARLVNWLCIRGFDVMLRWEVSGATNITVHAMGCPPVTLDPALHPDGYAFPMTASGPVSIEVANRYTRLRLELGTVLVYDPADVVVALPGLPDLQVPSVATELAALSEPLSHASFPVPELPAIEHVGLQGPLHTIVDILRAADLRPQIHDLFLSDGRNETNTTGATHGATRISHEVRDASDQVRAFLADALTRSMQTHLRPSSLSIHKDAS